MEQSTFLYHFHQLPQGALGSPYVQEPPDVFPSLGSTRPTCQGVTQRGKCKPQMHSPCCHLLHHLCHLLHHLCPSVMSPSLQSGLLQGTDPGAAYTNLVNATHFCPGYQSKMPLQCSTFIKVLMELQSSHQKARWLVFLCY